MRSTRMPVTARSAWRPSDVASPRDHAATLWDAHVAHMRTAGIAGQSHRSTYHTGAAVPVRD
jgi:hypothetical protein